MVVRTRSTIWLGFSIAPIPTSPQASFFEIGSMIWYPNSFNASNCFWVIKCSYILVFIAGAMNIRLQGHFQALATQVSRLSHIPLANLARVLALVGAIIKTSAQSRSYNQFDSKLGYEELDLPIYNLSSIHHRQ